MEALIPILPTRHGNRYSQSLILSCASDSDPTYEAWKQGILEIPSPILSYSDPTYEAWKP